MDMTFTDAELRLCQNFIIKLALDAGRIITAGFYQERKSFAEKSCQYDLVTETDSAVEKFVISAIAEKFPTHRFIGEESTAQSGEHQSRLTDEPTWMIDPIDGTMNFVHGYPQIALSIGLVVQKAPILGVIYNPIMNELYTARISGGAYRNGQPIRVSGTKDMARCLLMTEFGTNSDYIVQKHAVMANILQKLHAVRATGSAALNLALVASGAADSNYEFGLHCWDMAAGAIIVREAGGVVLNTTGANLDLMSRRVLCAATPELANEISSNLDSNIFKFPHD